MKIREHLGGLLHVASYNIHRCIGMDGLRHPERIGAVIRELGVDILGLQEVESSLVSLDGHSQVEYLSRASELHIVPGSPVFNDNGHVGNALLTRFPVMDVRQIDLSVPRREPRGALDVDLNCHGKIVRMIVTHFGLGIMERKRQVARLLSTIASKHSRPTILVGDLNEWIPGARSLRSLRESFSRTPRIKTFPSRFPVLPLDRIYAWPHNTLIRTRAHMSRLARIASDHLPLTGTVLLV